RVVKTAQHITRTELPSMEDLYSQRLRKKEHWLFEAGSFSSTINYHLHLNDEQTTTNKDERENDKKFGLSAPFSDYMERECRALPQRCLTSRVINRNKCR
ncbi:hypothetical protein NQZ68_033859, partial [Dissostichus eleginoides]